MSNTKEELDITITQILVLLEVINRMITKELDHPALKFLMKRDFKKLFKAGKDLDKHYRKVIRDVSNYDDPEEAYDTEADMIYDLIRATIGIEDDETWLKAISTVKNLKR